MVAKNYRDLSSNIIYRKRFFLAIFALTIISTALLGFSLGEPSGLSKAESLQLVKSSDIGSIIANPVNFLHKLLQLASINTLGLSEVSVRLSSVVISLATVLTFFVLLKNLYWKRLAISGTFLLASSSWFLHYGRLGVDSVMPVFAIISYLCALIMFRKSKKPIWLFLLIITTGLGLYTPMFIYILAASTILIWPEVKQLIQGVKTSTSLIAGFLGFIVSAPLVYASIVDLEVAKELLNIPQNLPGFKEYALNAVETFSHIFWRSKEASGFHLATLPMLDVFTVSMVALGVYKLEQAWKSTRTRLLLSSVTVLFLAVSLSPTPQAILVFTPFIYLLAANGVSALISQWHSIFPLNPIARTLGIAPIAILLILVSSYHLERYFTAWNNAPSTKSTFSETLLNIDDATSEKDQSFKVLIIDSDSNHLSAIQSISSATIHIKNDTEIPAQNILTKYDLVYVMEGSKSLASIENSLGNPDLIKLGNTTDGEILYRRFDK